MFVIKYCIIGYMFIWGVIRWVGLYILKKIFFRNFLQIGILFRCIF